MVGALDHSAAAIEELVFDPFERNAEVRAAVLIEINFALLFDAKQLASHQGETLAATLGDVSDVAQARVIR